MYWNIISTVGFPIACCDKLQHEMYWNDSNNSSIFKIISDKLQHEMYWNHIRYQFCAGRRKINYNMRCIETAVCFNGIVCWWDKLQHEMYWNFLPEFKWMDISRDKLQHEMYWNIIARRNATNILNDKLQHEMYWNVWWRNNTHRSSLINYNMRCIETPVSAGGAVPADRDKLQHEMYWNRCFKTTYWIQKTDKLQHEMYWNSSISITCRISCGINYNMRCIETRCRRWCLKENSR